MTWHSRISNASKGCQISCVLSSYAGPREKMHQRDVTVPKWVLALLWYPSLCLPSLQRSDPRDPFKTHGPGRVWTRRGGGRGAFHVNGFTSARNLWCDRSLPLPEDCPQYIPKGKPTPASKLAFVTWVADKMTYYLQWTYPKWVVTYQLWRFVLPCYV